jgi:hypothetical protein
LGVFAGSFCRQFLHLFTREFGVQFFQVSTLGSFARF